MTDYVLQFENLEPELPDYLSCIKYANFLREELNIGMFVPAKKVNGIWIVLEEPLQQSKKYKITNIKDKEDFDSKKWTADFVEYQEAKENVLFEGFEIVDLSDGVKRLTSPCGSYNLFWYSEEKGWYYSRGVEGQKIESLVNEKICLTQSAKQKLGL